jgi:hypothetical protein
MTRITGTVYEDVYIYNNMSLDSPESEKCFRWNLWRKSKHTYFMFIKFFPNILPFMK